MEKFTTRTSIFHLTSKGIVHKKVIEGVNVQPEDVKEDQEMLLKLTGGKKALVLVNGNAFHTMTPEAIDLLTAYASKSRHATAMVSQSLGVRIFVNTITLTSKKSPFKMFATEAQATRWLLTVGKEHKKTRKNIHNTAIAPRVHKKPICSVHIDRNGILIKKIFNGAHVDLKRAMLSEKKATKLAGRKKVLALIDQREAYTITPAAIKFLSEGIDMKYRIATAIIAPKQWNMQAIHSNISINQSAIRVFKDKTSAVKWLLSLNAKKRTVS